MNNLILTNPGQVAFTQDVVKFLQDAANAQFTGIITSIADNAIVSGCVPDGNGNISAGWVIINGELLPFAGGIALANFDVVQTTANRQYNDGGMKPFANTRVAVMTGAQTATSVPFPSFKIIKTLKQLAGVITDYSNDFEDSNGNVIDDDTKVPTMAALAALYDAINGKGFVPKGAIMMWSGTIAAIPDGWKLCNGTNGTPDLRDRFIVGAGNNYGVGDKGGNPTHTLSVAELPAHNHMNGVCDDKPAGHEQNVFVYGQTASGMPGQARGNIQNSGGGTAYQGYTSNSGNGQSFNILPPYYALAFIMFVGN